MPASRIALLALLPACLLAACASSPPVAFYRIEPLAEEAGVDGPAAEVLAFGPLTFPEYLKRPQIVSRGSGASMVIDDFNRWAEPLDEAVPRVVAANVDALLDDLIVVPFSTIGVRADLRLFGDLHRLDADEGGRVVLRMQWGVVGSNGETVVAPRTGRYEARALPQGDPGAIAAATTAVLGDLSRDIALALRAREGG